MSFEYKITFHMVSGYAYELEYSKKSKENLISRLKANEWKDVIIEGEEYGINFAHVTHYEIEAIE